MDQEHSEHRFRQRQWAHLRQQPVHSSLPQQRRYPAPRFAPRPFPQVRRGGVGRRVGRRILRRRRALLTSLMVVVVLGVTGWILTRCTVQRGWPQTEGTLTVIGLSEPVTVVRDEYGVPHIYAQSEYNLFFAQGYVHAQDRFWQMDLNRRQGRGALVKVLGEKVAVTDEQWQALNLVSIAERELDEMDAESRAILEAYAAGVNAWLKVHQEDLPLEFTLLSWRGRRGNDPVPWTAADSLIVALVVSWQSGAPRVDASLAARIVERVGPERGAFLLGENSHSWTSSGSGGVEQLFGQLSLATPNGTPETFPGRWALSSRVTLVSGERTASGQPLVAVDLPTGLSLPAPWYVMAWHLGEQEAAGASVPGLPDLLIGSGDQVAWEAWSETHELTWSAETLPWKRWLLTALSNTGEIIQLDDERAPQTVQEFQALQTDTFSAQAARLIPLLVQIEPQGWRQERVTEMLSKWDYHIGDNNIEAAFFVVYQLELARAAFADELGDDLFEAYVAQNDYYQTALDQIIPERDDEWWDDVNTPGRESREEILKRAYEPALEWIGRNYGDLHMVWEWDTVHCGLLHHPLGDVWPWDQLLSRDLTPDGWADTVNASPGGWPCTGGICQGGDFFRVKAVYGYRQILDAGDPATLWFTLLPGQSGIPFHAHYDDLREGWLAGDYWPLYLAASPGQVRKTESVLTLKPENLKVDRD